MECIANAHGGSGVGVTAVCESLAQPTAFATAATDGSVRLFDLRLPRRNAVITARPPPAAAGQSGPAQVLARAAAAAAADGGLASELLYDGATHRAWLTAGAALALVDLRLATVVAAFESDGAAAESDLTAFLPAAQQHAALGWGTILVANDDGGVFAVDGATCQPIAHGGSRVALPRALFGGVGGGDDDDTAWCDESFAGLVGRPLGNVCCGLGVAPGAGLCALSMGGSLGVFAPRRRAGESSSAAAVVAQVALAPLMAEGGGTAKTMLAAQSGGTQKRQLLNPPLPTALAIGPCDGLLAVARADGTYSVLSATPCGQPDAGGGDDDDASVVVVEELLNAPAHEATGLLTVAWHRRAPKTLIAVSLSGELTAWGVATFLEPVDEDEAEAAAAQLPPLLHAASAKAAVAETAGARRAASWNCATLLGSDGAKAVLGDAAGNLVVATIP